MGDLQPALNVRNGWEADASSSRSDGRPKMLLGQTQQKQARPSIPNAACRFARGHYFGKSVYTPRSNSLMQNIARWSV